MNSIYQMSALLGIATIGSSASLSASSISVNFHVGDDDNPAEHVISKGELAGSEVYGIITDQWNNIDVGSGGLHRKPQGMFPKTQLKDRAGQSTGVVLSSEEKSSYFVGYAASAEVEGELLNLPGNQDDLFNSYLCLGEDDSAVLEVSNLGSDYTAGGYSVIIYSDTDEGRKKWAASGPRQTLFKLTPSNGSTMRKFTEDDPKVPDGDSTFSGSFVLSDGVEDGMDYSNVVVFEGLTADSFTLELVSPDSKRGGISGFQIIPNAELANRVEIPEPAAMVGITGLVMFLVVTFRRRHCVN
ncbi:MAG: hypothetical protein ACSHYA_10750 [Opitutaceae bacterium]